ncbi:uncharacterized protein LOC143578915 [Bidens hawaiensis]|uniref:uncharacterized protein LOC143578915 n=1 Tax=Bidens hawaiensis TaxID=980011 RepID=UPI00404A6194
MGDANQTGKETISGSFQCPRLTKTNYTIWSMHMEVIFGIHGVWDVIDSGSNDAKQNNIAKALLFQSIPEEQILQIGNFKLEREMWDAIKTETIDEYASRITAISSKAATLGKPYEERKLVQKFFASLPSRFIQAVASLEQVLDLKTVGFEDVVGRLKTYEERIKGHVLRSEEVKFGDGSYVDICGKESILLVGKTGEQQLLTDIYYIPSLQSNIISLGQATESGCDIRMKDDYLLMYDDQGKLLMRVTRSKNRLYTIKLKTGKPVCLQARIDNENWLWHTRLGHLNFESMKQMVNNNMVIGMPKVDQENQICDSCLVGKQTRKPFRSRRLLEQPEPWN